MPCFTVRTGIWPVALCTLSDYRLNLSTIRSGVPPSTALSTSMLESIDWPVLAGAREGSIRQLTASCFRVLVLLSFCS